MSVYYPTPAASSPGSSNAGAATVSFSTFDTEAAAVVTGQAWVTASSYIVCQIQGEDAQINQLKARTDTLVVGTGFTITVHAPSGFVGDLTVNFVGV